MVDEMETSPGSRFDVAVIGAGQAGLAIGYFLAEQGRRFTILEASDSIGAAWRSRWDSLVLFTPRRYDGLPGIPFPGDPDGYPGRDEVIDYLESYASTFELPVQLNSPVQSVASTNDGFILNLGERTLEADQVVVATGPFQVPNVPAFAADLASDVVQMHSTGYRRPSDVPEGTVVVVGGGNTGFQIAKELSATHSVHLAIGSRQTPLPQRVLGRDLFWWLTKTGLIKKTVESRIGRRARSRHADRVEHAGREAPWRSGQAACRGCVRRCSDLRRRQRARRRCRHLGDGLPLRVQLDRRSGLRSGRPVLHRRGVTDYPGLYFLGLTWQHTRGSALLGWVKDDAEFIAEHIAANADDRKHAGPAEAAEPSRSMTS